MSLYVLDTDSLSLWQYGHPNIAGKIALVPQVNLSTTVITVQEQLDGWRLRLNRVTQRNQIADLYSRLANSVRFLARLPILDYTLAAIDQYEALKSLKLNIGKMDLRIAAIVLVHRGIIVTRNTRDFQRIPGLHRVDWSV